MPDPRPTLLLTRPLLQSQRFAAQFRARFGADWPVLIAPQQQIAPLTPDIPAARALVFSSASAVAPVASMSPAAGRPAWCVGARTAAAAAAAGFEVVGVAGDAQALVHAILAAHPAGPLLHAHGRHLALDIARLLNEAGIAASGAVVYDQVAQPMPAAGRAALAAAAPLLVPLFSPRSARLFAAAAQGAAAPLWLAPISAAVAAECVALAPRRLALAPQPDATGVLRALAQLMPA